MELEALDGAPQRLSETVRSSWSDRSRPGASGCAQRGYKVVEAGINLLAIHKTPVVTKLQIPELPAQSSAT
jgi:hypothetical protein